MRDGVRGLGVGFACMVAPLVVSASLVGACGAAAPPPATSPAPSAASPAPSTSSSIEPPEATASAAPPEAPSSPPVASAAASEAPPPPCIDGQILMGACICEKGKGVDATGHCVYMPCPSEHGGETFHDPKTGDCMECRPGTRPTKDGRCER